MADSLTQNLPFLDAEAVSDFCPIKESAERGFALLSKVVAHLEGEELEDVQALVPKDIADYFCLTETPGSGRLMGVDEIPPST